MKKGSTEPQLFPPTATFFLPDRNTINSPVLANERIHHLELCGCVSDVSGSRAQLQFWMFHLRQLDGFCIKGPQAWNIAMQPLFDKRLACLYSSSRTEL